MDTFTHSNECFVTPHKHRDDVLITPTFSHDDDDSSCKRTRDTDLMSFDESSCGISSPMSPLSISWTLSSSPRKKRKSFGTIVCESAFSTPATRQTRLGDLPPPLVDQRASVEVIGEKPNHDDLSFLELPSLSDSAQKGKSSFRLAPRTSLSPSEFLPMMQMERRQLFRNERESKPPYLTIDEDGSEYNEGRISSMRMRPTSLRKHREELRDLFGELTLPSRGDMSSPTLCRKTNNPAKAA